MLPPRERGTLPTGNFQPKGRNPGDFSPIRDNEAANITYSA
jgi:hypothetical protein